MRAAKHKLCLARAALYFDLRLRTKSRESIVTGEDRGNRMSVKFVLNLAKTVLFLILEAPIRPRWAYYRLRSFYYNYYKNRFHAERVSEYEQRQQPLTKTPAALPFERQTEADVGERARPSPAHRQRLIHGH